MPIHLRKRRKALLRLNTSTLAWRSCSKRGLFASQPALRWAPPNFSTSTTPAGSNSRSIFVCRGRSSSVNRQERNSANTRPVTQDSGGDTQPAGRRHRLCWPFSTGCALLAGGTPKLCYLSREPEFLDARAIHPVCIATARTARGTAIDGLGHSMDNQRPSGTRLSVRNTDDRTVQSPEYSPCVCRC